MWFSARTDHLPQTSTSNYNRSNIRKHLVYWKSNWVSGTCRLSPLLVVTLIPLSLNTYTNFSQPCYHTLITWLQVISSECFAVCVGILLTLYCYCSHNLFSCHVTVMYSLRRPAPVLSFCLAAVNEALCMYPWMSSVSQRLHCCALRHPMDEHHKSGWRVREELALCGWRKETEGTKDYGY